MLAKAFKMPAWLKKRLRVTAELSHWLAWDAAIIDALHDYLFTRRRARVTLRAGAARVADFVPLA